MSFHNATQQCRAEVGAAYRPGKQALIAAHARQIQCGDEHRILGSIDLDAALAPLPAFAQLSRWDYGIGYRPPLQQKEVAVWVEVHSASTGEVGAVLRKLAWLKNFLKSECVPLWNLTHEAAKHFDQFIWVASGAVHINKNSKQARQLSAAGLRWPRSSLRLP